VLEQAVANYQVSVQIGTTAAVKSSQVLDVAAPIAQHRKKLLVEYVGGGLFAGLMLGMSIVIIRALVSDRPRRRDDIARALGAPVRLSVGKVRLSRQGLAGAQSGDVNQITAYLGRAMRTTSRSGPAALAVVPVDDVQIPAFCLTSFAVSCATLGMNVVVADLCRGAPAARLLGVTDPGVHPVSIDGANLIVAIPDGDDVVPIGPLRHASGGATAPLAAACSSADIVLTFAVLDPSVGGEHLAGWATAAVVMLTAGQPSLTRIHAVGEMIRLAGTPAMSAVLIGADRADHSLGVTRTSIADQDAGITQHSDVGGYAPRRQAPV
jgi:hypothetical protein